MTYTVTYMSYEGNLRTVDVEADDEESAISAAYDDEGNYSGDNIQKIIGVEQT